MDFVISSDLSRGCAIIFFINSVFRKEKKLYIYKYNKIDININVKSLMYLFKKEKKVLLCRQKRTIMGWDSMQDYNGGPDDPPKKANVNASKYHIGGTVKNNQSGFSYGASVSRPSEGSKIPNVSVSAKIPVSKIVDKVKKVFSRKKADKSKTTTIKSNKPGQKSITFRKDGLHKSTGTPPGDKISAAKHKAAGEGKYGPLAKKQEDLYKNVLKG